MISGIGNIVANNSNPQYKFAISIITMCEYKILHVIA